MICKIVKDVAFLQQKSGVCTKEDLFIAKDLQDTLQAYSSSCVGLAANMIGHKKTMMIVDTRMFPLILINPVIVSKSGPYEVSEGCLSLLGQRKTTRYQNIIVKYLDVSWKQHQGEFSGFVAEIIQHEMDHFVGVLI